jgi:hypothetical protein
MFRRFLATGVRLLRRALETPRQRAQVAVAALLIGCACNVYLVRDLFRLWWPDAPLLWEPDDYAERLAAIRSVVPADARIRYVSLVYQAASLEHDLFATRFALAPRCVVADGDAPYVLIQGEPGADVPAGGQRILLEDRARGFKLVEPTAPR